MAMQEGKKIWVESLLTREEWKECYQKFKDGTHNLPEPPEFFDSEVKWRHKMGEGFTPEEIKLINSRLDALKKTS